DVFASLDHAAKLGAKVLLLPEYAPIGTWAPTPADAELAASHAKSHIAAVAEGAGRHGGVIAFPTAARDARELFSTPTPGGAACAEMGRYRKTHLTAEERRWAHAGDSYPVFETPFGRIGIMAGYDALFPETSRCLAAAAADIVLWPAAMREAFERELIAVPRAPDNRVALVVANRLDS